MSELNQHALGIVQDITLDYITNERPFTSVDIANQAKSRGAYAHNRAVADWLRSNAIPLAHRYGRLYNQTLIEVDSKVDGATLAYLYHEINDNPDDYLDRDQNPQPYQQPTQPPVVDPVQQAGRQARDALATLSGRLTTSSTDGPWKNQPRDARGRWISQ